MKRVSQKIQIASREITLTEAKKATLRKRVVVYMEHQPLRTNARQTPSSSSSFFAQFLFGMRHYTAATLMLALVIGTTGVTFAAEETVPGDVLYAIKVHFNEEVVEALSFGQEAKTNWEVKRAERRLAEASELAVNGELTEAVSAEVAERFAEHSQRIQAETTEIESEDPVLAAEMSTQFEDALLAHEAILITLAVEDESNTEAVQMLASAVRTAAEDAGKIRQDAEEVIAVAFELSDPQPAMSLMSSSTEAKLATDQAKLITGRTQDRAEDIKKRAENRLTREGYISDRDLTSEYERLTFIEGLIAQGEVAYQEDRFTDAYQTFREAATRSEKLIRFMDAEEAFAVDPNELDQVAEDILVGGDLKFFQPSTTLTTPTTDSVTELLKVVKERIDNETEADIAPAYKRARALLMRAEIAANHDNQVDAESFREAAEVMAQDALTRSEVSVDNGNEEKTEGTSDDNLNTESEEKTITETVVEPKPLEVMVTMFASSQVFSGWMEAPVCGEIEANLTTGEDDIVLALAYDTTLSCETGLLPYQASTSNEVIGTLSEVTVNGDTVPFVISTTTATASARGENLEYVSEPPVLQAPQTPTKELLDQFIGRIIEN